MDVRYAAKKGVSHYTVQTQRAIEKVLRTLSPFEFPPPVEIAVRVKTLNPKAKVNLSTKLGATPEDALAMLKSLKDQAGVVPGISIHTGSQNTDPASYGKGIRLMTDLAKEVGGIKTLNIGGGLPVNYFEHENYDIRGYLDYITSVILQSLPNNLEEDPKIIIELGRAIIAEAIDLLIPVLDIEKRDGGMKCVYFYDGVFMSFSDYVVHGWKYNFQTFGKGGRLLSENKEKNILHGITCDSGDTLGEVYFPEDLKEGDYVRVNKAGAYMASQATNFHKIPPPKCVTFNKQK